MQRECAVQMVASNLRFEAGVTRAVGSDMRAEGIDQHIKFSDTFGRYLTSVNAIKRRSIPFGYSNTTILI